MAAATSKLDDISAEEYAHFRADLLDQYRRNCLGCVVSVCLIVLITRFNYWSLIVVGIWAIILGLEAVKVFTHNPVRLQADFERWQERNQWLTKRSQDRSRHKVS